MRVSYYDTKREEIKEIIIIMINDIIEMSESYTSFSKSPTEEKMTFLTKTERYINKNEKQVEKYILELISLQLLDTTEIKWLFSMARIIRELERIGDEITNIVTISNDNERKELTPLINEFFAHEQQMMKWLAKGIKEDDSNLLEKVIAHDVHVNKLQKSTFQDVVDLANNQKPITESNLKMILISRFLERIGDNLANVAKSYIAIIN